MSPRNKKKVGELLAFLRGAKSLVILIRDSPAPDPLAAAAALRKVANKWLRSPVPLPPADP